MRAERHLVLATLLLLAVVWAHSKVDAGHHHCNFYFSFPSIFNDIRINICIFCEIGSKTSDWKAMRNLFIFFSFGIKFIQFNVQYSQFHEITMNKIQQINWFFFSQRLHLVRVHRPRAHLHHHRRPHLRNHRKRLQNIQNILNTRKRRKESMKYISKVEKTVNEPVVA